MAETMSIDNNDPPIKNDSEESVGSSPEGEAEPGQANNNPQEAQQPKRKGGRKPIYATSEERKQRNRQAQAAFRERRTEYIKQLEETIRVHEANLQSLQGAHRHAAEECLMLRYKNSLLERILLEKGIDVQDELRAKTGSPNLGPTHMPQNLVQPPPMPRALLNNRHHPRRSTSSIAPKVEPGINTVALPPPTPSGLSSSMASPKSRPTPSSLTASPTTTASVFCASPTTSSSDHMSARSAMPPTTAAMKSQPASQLNAIATATPAAPARPTQLQMQAAQQQGHRVRIGGISTTSFYPTPAFQNHIEQLEQEYDAAADLMDDTVDPPDTPSGPGPYPGAAFSGEPQPMSLSSPTTTLPPLDGILSGIPGTGAASHLGHAGYPSMTQLLDPALDWDPFGLSASMQFPTQFSFDTSNMR